MPRIARKDLDSNFLHVIIQGINKEFIFKDNSLKDFYLKKLIFYLKDTNIDVISYCLMDNHSHFLFYTPNINQLSKLMQKLNTSYAKLYNKKNNRLGYVFRDRYFTQCILNEQQLYNCIIYIHNNPCKANIVQHPQEYKYSSYLEYLTPSNTIFISNNFDSITNGIALSTISCDYKNIDIENIIDVPDYTLNHLKVIEKFTAQISLEDIKKEPLKFNKLLLTLRFNCGWSLRDMSNYFNINKDKLNKIINLHLK